MTAASHLFTSDRTAPLLQELGNKTVLLTEAQAKLAASGDAEKELTELRELKEDVERREKAQAEVRGAAKCRARQAVLRTGPTATQSLPPQLTLPRRPPTPMHNRSLASRPKSWRSWTRCTAMRRWHARRFTTRWRT